MGTELKLSVLGFGNMGQAIVKGLINKGILPVHSLLIYDPDEEKQKVARELGINVCSAPELLIKENKVILIAVKPQMLKEALSPFKNDFMKDIVIVSIVAGVPIQFFKQFFNKPLLKVIRTMPNTPALVGCGITGISLSSECSEEEVKIAEVIFSSVGEVVFVPEEQIDIVTAVSGSGPAYFFYLCEALISAGEALGLSRDIAYKLAVHTLYGAGALVKSTGESPEVLRMRVTSKGGTTEKAIKYFQSKDFETIVKEAVRSAYLRAKELGKQNLSD